MTRGTVGLDGGTDSKILSPGTMSHGESILVELRPPGLTAPNKASGVSYVHIRSTDAADMSNGSDWERGGMPILTDAERDKRLIPTHSI